MPTFMLKPLSGRYLSFEEREEIALLKAQRAGVREIARRVGRHPSTISWELKRNLRCQAGAPSCRVTVWPRRWSWATRRWVVRWGSRRA
jgi:transposase-like protein